MSRPLIADTGGLLRALARSPSAAAAWPEFQAALVSASLIVVPALVLAEVDYFLRSERAATAPPDLVRALQIDAKFAGLKLGLVDGAVAAVAERRRILRILTTDRRDFLALRVGAR